ncbi:MAG: hypothetical protein I3J02_00425 [Prevotella sp.]|nr:hypothetical protein [Prevotella sp.]
MAPKSSLLLFLLAVVLQAPAQIVSKNQETVLDIAWTEAALQRMEYEEDLHLSGPSTVKYRIMDTSRPGLLSTRYRFTVALRVVGKSGKIKSALFYRFSYHTLFLSSKYVVEMSLDRRQWTVVKEADTPHQEIAGTINVKHGETGDHITIAVLNAKNKGNTFSLTYLATTSTRYDLYDDHVLFRADSSGQHRSNEIRDHAEPIDIMVHRMIAGNGGWTTLCLPFDMTDDQVRKSLGNDVVYSQFTDVEPDKGYIHFHTTTEGMKAGQPYLVKKQGSTLDSFFADDVVLTRASVREANKGRGSKKKCKGYYWVGILQPTRVNAEDTEKIFNPNARAAIVSTTSPDGKLHLRRTLPNSIVNGFTAYLVFPDDSHMSSSGPRNIEDFVVCIDSTTVSPTIIKQINTPDQWADDEVYTMGGQRVGTHTNRLSPGIYIRRGQKFVVK